jgi:hypothetical protein
VRADVGAAVAVVAVNPDLDYACAIAQGLKPCRVGAKVYVGTKCERRLYSPSTLWRDAGPILESMGVDRALLLKAYAARVATVPGG